MNLKEHDEDMCYKNDNSFDIMKVYLPNHPYAFMNITYQESNRKLIWERNNVKEMTMREIEEHLGCKIKIVEG